ncbi:MAG: PhzF family phenazine biosynthesis protein [Yoonia sp.]|uniref:PhzF family phenazine biosynthesis protein n=1 Tax=Yoonia sp. TaxID=2212373 RepID=UPI003EF3E0BF
MTQFFVYDVFTASAFGGNQLAVIPDALALPEDKLQKIAREFNFSETIFLYPPADPAHTARARIFTPTMEVPFAGHPTIGATVALHDQGHASPMVLELGVGPVACDYSDGMASFRITTPLDRFGDPAPSMVAAALSLATDSINTTTHAPVQAGVGLPFVIAELQSIADLDACIPVTDQFREGAERYPTPLDFAIFAYVRDGSEIHVRMFAPLDNIPEDPATGSASAALAALLTDILGRDLALDIHQGEAMGRPSHIKATTQQGDPVTVTISGQAVRTMQGNLLV